MTTFYARARRKGVRNWHIIGRFTGGNPEGDNVTLCERPIHDREIVEWQDMENAPGRLCRECQKEHEALRSVNWSL